MSRAATTAAAGQTAAPEPQQADLTDEQIDLSLRHQWRPGWPEDRQSCLQDPILGPLIRGLAYRMRRGAWNTGHTSAAPAAAAPVPTLTFDARRAAANDHDD